MRCDQSDKNRGEVRSLEGVSLQKLGGEKFGAVQAAKGGTGPCNAPGNSRANGISVIWEI